MTPLELRLRERIAREGPLSFRDVMQAALYDPDYGYYTHLRGFGARGDFITSPERHPAFGWLLGRQALDVWEALDRPIPFRILELGAGNGALAESLMWFLRSQGLKEVVYTLDEVSPSLKEVQRERLTDAAFRWDGTQEPHDFIVANEVADALPVHRAVFRAGQFHEVRVGISSRGSRKSRVSSHGSRDWFVGRLAARDSRLATIDGELMFVEADQPSREIARYFEALHHTPPEGSIVDVSLELEGWVKSLSRRLERGLALVLDYAASPPRDSLLTYYRHTLGSDPLIRLGQQDISAHVDLRSLVRMAIAEGLRAGATAQRGLLFNLGFGQIHSSLTGMTDRQALAHLVDEKAAGGQIVAVFLLRGMPADYKPAGAVGRNWPDPQNVPALPPNEDEADFLSQWQEAFQ